MMTEDFSTMKITQFMVVCKQYNSPFRLRVRGMQFLYVTSQLIALARP